MRGDFDEDEFYPVPDEPTVLLAAEAYARAYRPVLAMRRAGRCTRERGYGDEREAPCWQLTIDAEDICANCKARDEATFRAARQKLRNAKRRLHRALEID